MYQYHTAEDVSDRFTIQLTTETAIFITISPRVKLQNYPALLTIRAEVVDQCLDLFDLKVCENSHC